MNQKIKSGWDEWEITEQLGKGEFGKVYKAAKKNNDGVETFSAIKIITVPSYEDKQDSSVKGLNATDYKDYLETIVDDYKQEIEKMISLRGSNNIVHVDEYKIIEEKSGFAWNIYIRMELLKSFDKYIAEKTAGGNLTETEIIKIGTDISAALELCARQTPPIIHGDIKSGNILVNQYGNFMLNDFGVARASKRIKKIETLRYSAPEVITQSTYEANADIYSLGIILYKLSNNNKFPFCNPYSNFESTYSEIEEAIDKRLSGAVLPKPLSASDQLSHIILKACEFDPAKRFQSAWDFQFSLKALSRGEYVPDMDDKPDSASVFNLEMIPETATQQISKENPKNKKRRGILVILTSALICAVLFIAGYFILIDSNTFSPLTSLNSLSPFSTVGALEIDPQYITISLQQASNLTVTMRSPNNDVTIIDPANIKWTYADDSITQIDNGRILGVNVGTTLIEGTYQNQTIGVIVNIVEPMDGLVDIVQQYELGRKIGLFGGTAEREHIDGNLNVEAEFVSPESIATANDGTLYIADSGVLRKIKNNAVESIEIEPFYMTSNIVRCNGNDVYILTHKWEEVDGSYAYAIVKLLNNGETERIYTSNTINTMITDFGFLDNKLYFLEQNGLYEVYLKMIDLQNIDINIVGKLDNGTQSLTFDEKNKLIYLANPETGVIQVYDGVLRNFAGIKNERAFIDGSAPLFYMPYRIKYANNALYIWDFNTLRKIEIDSNESLYCTTFAGEASPIFDWDIVPESNAEDVILPNSNLSDFAIVNDKVFLTDPKRGIIWRVE